MKKKGFTLIELLAVIVILAVIAIIVTPMIASTVNSAKSSSLKASASGIIDAAEQYCSRKMVSDSTFTAHSYQINESVANEIGFTYNAEISGTLAIYSDCSVALAITDGTYQATKDKTSESVATTTKTTNFEDTAKALVILTPESCFTTADSGLGDGTIKITDYTCTDPDIIIPGTVGGKTVVAIGDSAFKRKYFSYISGNSNIKKLNSNYNSSGVMRKPYYSDVIVQPSEISSAPKIGDITSVDLSYVTELKTIGTSAFDYNSISSLNLSNLSKLTTMGDGAFAYNQISSLDLSSHSQLVTIGAGAFFGNKISSLNLSNLSKLTTMGDEAFAYNQISSLDLSSLSELTTIGESAFAGNLISGLDLNSLSELTTIGNYAFSDNKLTTLELGNLPNLTTIGTSAFSGSYNGSSNVLDNITLKDLPLLTTIGDNAFADNKLSTIELNNLPSLTTIGKYAFTGMTTKSITLKDLPALVTIDDEAFSRDKGTYTDSNGNDIPYNTCSPTYTFDNVPNVAAYNSTDKTGLNPTAFGAWASECVDTITTTVCDGETAPTVIIKNTVSTQLQGDFYNHIVHYYCQE